VSVEVKLSPHVSACYNYIDSSGAEKKVSVIVVPIGIERKGEKTVISWACSMGATCHNRECRYSFLAKTPVARGE
jgi:hypothetical protein